MRVFNDEEMYKELIEYACVNCDVVSVTKKYYRYDEITKVMQIVLEKLNATEEEIAAKYSEKYLDELYDKLCDDEDVFAEKLKRRKVRKKLQKIDEEHRRSYIKETIESIVYNYNTTMWLRKYKGKTFLKRKMDYGVEYCMKLNEAVKRELLEKNSFSDWQFPETVGGICFYKDGKCWLETLVKWGGVELYINEEREYKYLKSIGVQFDEKKFRPISDYELAYINKYKLNNLK